MRTAYQGLEGIPLIDTAMLSEAFLGEYDPQGTEWTKEPKGNKSPSIKESSSALPPDATPLTHSLVSITAKKIIQMAIAEPDGSDDSMELLLRSPLDAPIIELVWVTIPETTVPPPVTVAKPPPTSGTVTLYKK
jgi:hypothetical protein